MMTPEEIIESNQGKRYLCGVSGGKDSTALALYLKELKVPVEYYFADTGWESVSTLSHLSYLEGVLGQKITHIYPELDMQSLIKHKRIFPSRRIRYCTELLKVKPVKKHFSLPDYDIVMCTGERSEESPSRAKKPNFSKDEWMGCHVWLPIKEWTWQQVFDIAKRHGVRPNPLYLKGYKRVGCYPCIFANKPDYKAFSDDPASKDRVNQIRNLEKELNLPWVQLLRESGNVEGIDALLEWATNGFQEDIFDTDNFSCSSHYKLCE